MSQSKIEKESIVVSLAKKEVDKTSSTESLEESEREEPNYVVDEFYNPTWRSNIWPNFDYPKDKQKTLFKLDFCVLFCAMFSTFIKYIDKSNLSAAYVSGMQEDLKILGDELSYANTGYSIFGIIAGIAGGFLMVQFNTKWYMIGIECLWTVLTFCFAFIKTPTQMVALRTIIGIESAHFSILMVYIGSYYKTSESSRRCNIINAFTAIGPMSAFALQARCVTSLDGVNGFAAWQWLFFVDTIISVVCIITQVVFLPNILEKAKPNWMFSEEEIVFLRHRLPPRNVDENAKKLNRITWQDIKNFLLDWRVYFVWCCSVCSGFGQDAAQAIPFYFKGWRKIDPTSYTTEQVNILTIPAYSIQLVICFVTGWISDTVFKGQKWQVTSLASIWVSVVCFFLATHKVFEESRALMMFFFYNTTVAQGIAGQFWAETQDLFAHDTKLRAFASSGLNPAFNIRSAIFGPIIYPSSKLPETYAGYYTSGAISVIYVVMIASYGIYKTYVKRQESVAERELIEPDVDA